MRKHALVTFYNEAFDVCRVVRLAQSLLTESSEAAELPNLVLPASDLQPFIKIAFPFAHAVDGIVYPKPFVWHFIDDNRPKSVQCKLERSTPNHGGDHVIPRGDSNSNIDGRDHQHRWNDTEFASGPAQ